jgi:hypothetical protein
MRAVRWFRSHLNAFLLFVDGENRGVVDISHTRIVVTRRRNNKKNREKMGEGIVFSLPPTKKERKTND